MRYRKQKEADQERVMSRTPSLRANEAQSYGGTLGIALNTPQGNLTWQ